MRKFSNFCGIFATVFVTTTIILLASCSQDDDYYESDMYTLAEMETRNGGNGGDPGGGPTAHSFPSINAIKSSAVVLDRAAEAWSQMLGDSVNHEFRERGFLIYYKHSTGELYCGSIKVGSDSDVELFIPDGDREICATYHCHTSLRYAPSSDYRPTGPSDDDISIAESCGIPGIVEDYSVDTLRGGASANLPHYRRTYGPLKRADIYF